VAAGDPREALDQAIERAGRFGWRVVRRRRRSAELSDASGGNRLYLEVGNDGIVRDRQTFGERHAAPASAHGFRFRVALLAFLATFAILIGVGAGLALALAPSARARVGALSPDPPNQASITRALAHEQQSGSAASFAHLQVAVSGDSVVLAVQPRLLTGTDALTVESVDTLVAARSIFHSFPSVGELTVAVFGDSPTAVAPGSVQLLALIRLSSDTAAGLDLPALEARVLTDNTALFCRADGYQIAPLLYQELIQERLSSGCLNGAMKG
jgi:hypothetical protein